MASKNLLKVLVILIVAALSKSAYWYVFVPDDEEVFTPCDVENTVFIDKFFDLTALSLERLDEESIHVEGTVKIADAFPKDVVFKYRSNVYKKIRGVWQNTLYTLSRPDFCKAIFDPTEPWHHCAATVPKHQQICPVVGGQKFDLNCTANVKVFLPNYNLEGAYNCIAELTSDAVNVTMCMQMFFQFYRLK